VDSIRTDMVSASPPADCRVNDLIKRALLSAEIPSRLEPKSLAQHDDRRPDGLSLLPWSNKCLAWDFTCPDTLAPSHLNTVIAGFAPLPMKPS